MGQHLPPDKGHFLLHRLPHKLSWESDYNKSDGDLRHLWNEVLGQQITELKN